MKQSVTLNLLVSEELLLMKEIVNKSINCM